MGKKRLLGILVIVAAFSMLAYSTQSGFASGPSISFDQASYEIENSGTLTVNDVSKAGFGSVQVVVTSTSSPSGIFLNLLETGEFTGVFSGQIVFTAGPNFNDGWPANLHVSPGDALFASYGAINTTASIRSGFGGFSVPTVSFDQPKYLIKSGGYVTVNDPSMTGTGSVSASVTSTSSPEGLGLQLLETPPNSGIFTGQVIFTQGVTSNDVTPPTLHVGSTDSVFAAYANATTAQSQIISSSSNGFGGNAPPPTDIVRFVESDTYQLGQSATLQVNDASAKTVSCPADYASTICVQVQVTSRTDATGITLYLTQNSADAHLYTLTSPGLLQFLTSSSSASTPDIKVNPTAAAPDVVAVKYPSTGTAKGTAHANIVQSISTTTLPGVPPTTVTRASCSGDSDGDGICDNWETSTGISIPLSVVNPADTGFYTLSCNPNAVYSGATGSQVNDPLGDQVCPSSSKKDIYIQVDYMQGQTPSTAALQDVVKAFASSQVSNTGSTNGVNLHIFVENKVPWQHYTYWAADPVTTNPTFMSLKQQYFGSELATCPAGSFFISQTGLCTTNPTGGACPAGFTLNGNVCTASPTCQSTPTGMTCSQYASDLVNAKRQFFHYSMFQYDQDPTNYQSSGTAETPGNDFVVSLGEFAGHVGSVGQQAETFMHELGHNLGLRHGGADDINCKANYPSVMNYMSEFNVTDGGFVNNPLDFSRAAYSAINEQNGLSDTSNGITNPAGSSGTTAVRSIAVGGYANGVTLPVQTYTIPAHVVVPPTAGGVKISWDGAGKQTAGPYTQNTRYLGIYGCTDNTVGATAGITTVSGITLGAAASTTGTVTITQTMTFSSPEVMSVGVPSVAGQNAELKFNPMFATVSPGSSSAIQTLTITVPFSTTTAITGGAIGSITVPFTTSPSQVSNPTVTGSSPTTTAGTLGGSQTNSASMSGALDSYNDWANLIYNFRGFSTFDDSQRVTGISLPPDELQSTDVQNPGSITPAPGSITVNTEGGTVNLGQKFISTGSFADQNSASWTGSVNYGDGSPTMPLTLSGTSFTLSHLYSTKGTFLITVNIKSNTGLTGTGNASVAVNPVYTPVFNTKWGSYGIGFGQFKSPFGVVAGSGYVYVADSGNNRIEKFTRNGVFQMAWGSFGTSNGQFNKPTGVAVDGSGNIYVTDHGNNRVQKFTANGTFVTAWGSYGSALGQLNGPSGVAVGSGYVYVADSNNNRIERFTSSGGSPLAWGSSGNSNGKFHLPIGVALGSGNVYVSDSYNDRIQEFTGSGSFLTKWGLSGNANGNFTSPSGVAVDSFGIVYVADSVTDRIQEFTGSGSFLTKWGSSGAANGQFVNPIGISVDSSGNIFVADSGNNRIQVFH